MAVVVSIAGMGVACVGLLGVVAPARLAALLGSWRFLTSFPTTVALRVGFGALFVFAASECRFPALVRLMGLLEIVGAACLLGLGADRLRRFVEWWLARPPSFVRYWCLAALAFGIGIAYSGDGGM